MNSVYYNFKFDYGLPLFRVLRLEAPTFGREFRGQLWSLQLTDNILYKSECYQIQGAVFEVYREMGCGFLEAVYQECLERELKLRKIPFVAQPTLKLAYKGEALCQTYKPDLICFDTIILELKAISAISGEHRAQVLNYLKTTGIKLGLLVNFGCYPKATVERLVL
jgi:GxxExxY protein